jgi:hypothetical protein
MALGMSAGCSGALTPSAAVIVTVNLGIKSVKIASQANGQFGLADVRPNVAQSV